MTIPDLAITRGRPAGQAMRRGICPDCQLSWAINRLGVFIPHGPVTRRCPGSYEPATPTVYPTVLAAIRDFERELCVPYRACLDMQVSEETA